MTVLALGAVTKRFGTTTALDDVTLELEPGSTTALLGPNGAGKSTLVALALGLRRPDAGTVRVRGRDPRDWRARTAVGAALQELAFPQPLRVRELVTLVARHFAAARADDVLERFGLAALVERQLGALSGGQRRRLGVALAFLGRPSLVVLDEPTAALDTEARRAVWAAVAAARADGAAVLVATHELGEAEAVASHAVVLDRGRVVADGPLDGVRAAAGATRVRFRADGAAPHPEARLVDGWAVVDTDDPERVVRELVDARVPLPELEVRRLALGEALDALTGEPR